jgi:hypothetical protein
LQCEKNLSHLRGDFDCYRLRVHTSRIIRDSDNGKGKWEAVRFLWSCIRNGGIS